MLAAIQAHLVADQVTRHGAVARECRACGRVQSSKGHYRSTFRSVFGNVPMRVRRFQACGCRADGPKTVPALVTRKAAIAPELRYLTAKLAALMPFRAVAAVLNEVLPLSSTAHASTVRNRTLRVGRRLQHTCQWRIANLCWQTALNDSSWCESAISPPPGFTQALSTRRRSIKRPPPDVGFGP